MQDGTFGDHPAWGFIINALDAYQNRFLELKVVLGIVVADVLDHLTDEGQFAFWQFAALDVLAKHVAEQAAEVLVARIGEEGAAVGEHSDKAAQQAQHGEGIELLLDAVLLVVEPPSAAELYLALDGTLLEVAYHGANHVEGVGIDGVEDGAWQHVLHLETVEEACHCLGTVPLANAVETGVWSDALHHSCVGIAYHAVVELLGPSVACIHTCQVEQDGCLELLHVVEADWHGCLAPGSGCEHRAEDSLYFRVGVVLGIELAQAVVAKAATESGKIVVALLQGVDETLVVADGCVGSLGETAEIIGICLRVLYCHSLVGTPSG